ncbi:MAG: TlpA family protein disulfide reductase [Fimbriimonadaceae bacterium]|nr:TlpA family protein disulfide reductase [Chthonomonadaceae bacterium]MCO5297109.1 TlpA family protein disulfide reductase [Fimbriimonadaceae bacterium]
MLVLALGVVACACGQQHTAAGQAAITLELALSQRALDMEALQKNMMGYMPSGQALVDEKPKGIAKEPPYNGKPLYGAFQVGNGPRCVTYFAVDEAPGQTGRLFVDLNQNGDLTDDGPPTWDEAKEIDGIVSYSKAVEVHASWGSPISEEESGTYTLFLYKRDGDPRVGWTKFSAREGRLTLHGKPHRLLLVENGSDGIFTVPKQGDRTRRPIELMVDLNDDGLFTGYAETRDGKTMRVRERFSIDRPFELDGQWWDAMPSISGAQLTLVPSAPPGAGSEAPQAPVEEKSLLAAGTVAPDFVAQTPDGKPIRLSDFKGKVVILDFWATWCGPCKESMPGLQKIYDRVRDQGVVVLSLNVLDAKAPFDAWIAKNGGTTYTFTFAFDPAGRGKESIPTSKYNVSGIPTMYVIGRDGKVKDALVGSGNEANLVKALEREGVRAGT